VRLRDFLFRSTAACCACAAPLAHADPAAPASTAFVHVNVVPMDRDRVLRDQTVVVAAGKIVAVGRDAAICTVVTPAGDSVCDVVLALPAGHLMVHGLLPGDAHEIRLAVTGGTRRYATARGDAVLRQGESSSTLDVRLVP